jgi:hypothetical protein
VGTHKFLIFFLLITAISLPGWADTYRHPLGIAFDYPQDWSVRESAFTLLELVPPNPASNERGPTESYFLMAFGIHATQASDPRLVEQVEALIKQIAPFLIPKGDIETLSHPSKAAIMRWAGKSPTGVQARSDVYVLPGRIVSYTLIAIGEEAQIQSRQAAVRNIFGGFHFVPGLRDLQLTAAWQNSTDQTYMHLRKDGTFLATQENATPQTSTQSSTQSQKSDENQTAAGKWFAGDGKLYLLADGSTPLSFRYELKGTAGKRVMTLRDATGQEQILLESKPR